MVDTKTATWKQMKPKTRPPARKMAAMAYDAANGVCVLINGRLSEKRKLQDTWVYDLAKNEWRDMKPTGQPQVIGVYQAAYDKVNNVTVYASGSRTYLYRYAAAKRK